MCALAARHPSFELMSLFRPWILSSRASAAFIRATVCDSASPKRWCLKKLYFEAGAISFRYESENKRGAKQFGDITAQPPPEKKRINYRKITFRRVPTILLWLLRFAEGDWCFCVVFRSTNHGFRGSARSLSMLELLCFESLLQGLLYILEKWKHRNACRHSQWVDVCLV